MLIVLLLQNEMYVRGHAFFGQPPDSNVRLLVRRVCAYGHCAAISRRSVQNAVAKATTVGRIVRYYPVPGPRHMQHFGKLWMLVWVSAPQRYLKYVHLGSLTKNLLEILKRHVGAVRVRLLLDDANQNIVGGAA